MHARMQGRRHTQAVLLDRIAQEPVHVVRHSAADVAGAVARLALPAGEWPELPLFLQQSAAGGSPGHLKEVALCLFTSLAEAAGEHLQEVYPDLVVLVGRGLTEGPEAVRTAALNALLPLSSMVAGEKEVRSFHDLVGALLQVSGRGRMVEGWWKVGGVIGE